jgi:hypothetical protein
MDQIVPTGDGATRGCVSDGDSAKKSNLLTIRSAIGASRRLCSRMMKLGKDEAGHAGSTIPRTLGKFTCLIVIFNVIPK